LFPLTRYPYEIVEKINGDGTHTVMLHQGQVVLDVSGEQSKNMRVSDLLAMSEQTRGEEVTDDALLIG
jgi:putative ABC transport system ATP-binding protein